MVSRTQMRFMSKFWSSSNRVARSGQAGVWKHCLAALACLLFAGLFAPDLAAQEGFETEEGPLIDQQPYDLITLTQAAGGQSVKVFTLDFPNRQVPTSPKETDKLEVVVLQFPDRRYEIKWKDIDRIDLYEQRVYDEALQEVERENFLEAFQNLSFLIKNYPSMPRLETLRQEFLFKSAASRYAAGELTQTLSALEELRATAPGFRRDQVTTILSRVAGSLIDAFQKDGDLGSAKALLARLESTYGPSLPVVKEWEQRLQQMALAKKDEALALFEEKKYREARSAAVDMISIFPDLPNGKDLLEKINTTHPMVRVGVMQRVNEANPSSLTDWPARRAGRLVLQSIFQFLETGAEGGRYGFALGTFRLSDDRQELILSLDPNIQTSLDAFGLAQELLQRAEPSAANYDPSWAAIFKTVEAASASQVVVTLKRPNVLPHALLQWVLPNEPGAVGSLPGQYRVDYLGEDEAAFVLREGVERVGQPVEIIEIFYDDPKEAVNDLLRGEVDVLDQLYPADARQLSADLRLSIGSYALPTTHMLIPVSDNPYLEKDKFKRALLYATNRQAMLTGELLNSEQLEDGRLVSGPFPLGDGEADPLSYAYNPDIAPAEYNPQLAKLLLVMVRTELENAAEKSGEPVPEPKPLRIACPDFEFARVAVQAMIQQWMIVGIEAEMVIIPPGSTSEQLPDMCDLVYTTTTMWEPATDIERLLGGRGFAATDNPFIVQALEQLRRAKNWRSVRDAMQDLHQLVDYHLPVLPLWQIRDRFAVSKYVDGVGENPLSLYQNVDQWRLNLGFQQTASR